ncbi:hypothetical protein DACRYDRAFT_106069 [Dacryopinax primogenitus]|uniref:Uncharacterized protein n=1 Tax=Dacryopinax primogenitus (strain DJM 731) TaxID=1858805 RepID=M5G5E8_DACPD|nr:uncharacterized protein DACRYDRAFT_106069 [Dacryopinax primogenitus]EJU03909.1 hypothetical protein DACRYDRAFT_106069 [Dacryopinax primogenitus]
MASTRSLTSSRPPTTTPQPPPPPPAPAIGQLKTPQDQAVQAVSSALGELGSRLGALSGFGRQEPAGAPGQEKKPEEGEKEKGEQDYNPYTGAPLRKLVPLQSPVTSPSSSGLASPSSEPGKNAEPSLSQQLWAHLALVRKLQAELAQQHIEMENVTGRWSGEGLGLGEKGEKVDKVVDLGARGAAKNMGDEKEKEKEREKEKEKEREREREERGKQRQEAVKAIMSKLDELSRAVTAYHGTVTPSLDLTPLNAGRQRSQTLSHAITHADGALSDTALSEIGSSPPRRAGDDNMLGFRGMTMTRREGTNGRMVSDEFGESPAVGYGFDSA